MRQIVNIYGEINIHQKSLFEIFNYLTILKIRI